MRHVTVKATDMGHNSSVTLIALFCSFVFVSIEAVQYVFFGGLFQAVNSFVFGALMFFAVAVVFIGRAAIVDRPSIRAALARPGLLLLVNLTAIVAWAGYMGAVQLIEPAVAYTIGAGLMPITAWAAYRLGAPEGESLRNKAELAGLLLIISGIGFLTWVTVTGQSGFVRDNTWLGSWSGIAGVSLAMADGVFFTYLLMLCRRMNDSGVKPAVVFGLRFPLYVIIAGSVGAATAVGQPPALEMAWLVLLGLILTVPPLFALQYAVAHLSTLTISCITVLGPFIIFVLQIGEGRVEWSGATLVGLLLYSVGAMAAAVGALRASAQ
ncbi:MAG: hypothetical protein ACPGGK_12485 [Pikeienuella sp.]